MQCNLHAKREMKFYKDNYRTDSTENFAIMDSFGSC